MDRPSPKTLVVIQTDPMKNHRAVEALRIALGLGSRSEEHTSELQSPCNLVCRLLLEKKKTTAVSKLNAHSCTNLVVATIRGDSPFAKASQPASPLIVLPGICPSRQRSAAHSTWTGPQ